MEPLALIGFLLHIAYILSLVLILISFIISIINLKRGAKIDTFIIEIIALAFLLPGCLLMSMTKSDIWGALTALIVLFFAAIVSKNSASSFLALLGVILLLIKTNLGANFYYVSLKQFNSFFNSLNFFGFHSWFFYAIYLSAFLLILASLIYYIKKISYINSKFYYIIILVIIALCVGISRDLIISKNKITRVESKQITNQEIKKFVFVRDNNLWLTDTSGGFQPIQLTQLSKDDKGKKVGEFHLSQDEQYLAYLMGNEKGERYELDIINVNDKSIKSIYVTRGNERLSSTVAFSNKNLLVFGVYPDYQKLTKGEFKSGEVYLNNKVVDTNSNEIFSIANTNKVFWYKSDLVIIKRNGWSKVNIYLSIGGQSDPQKIGDVNFDESDAVNKIYVKEPINALVFASRSKAITNEDYLPIELQVFNMNTHQISKIEIKDRISPLTTFSDDMKYYTVYDSVSMGYFIKSVDKSTIVDLTNTNFDIYHSIWKNHQLICATSKGIVVIDLNGNQYNITENSQDSLFGRF